MRGKEDGVMMPPPVTPAVNGKFAEYIPEEFDWRKNGAINEIQDQGKCKSGWAFAATAAVEAALYNQEGKLHKLS